jgi:rRNA maturation endonuclease Nob1
MTPDPRQAKLRYFAYVCLKCGHEQQSMCEKCGSRQIVAVCFMQQHGDGWREMLKDKSTTSN